MSNPSPVKQQERRNTIRRVSNDRRNNWGGDQEFNDRRQVLDRRSKAKTICLGINNEFKINDDSNIQATLDFKT